MARDFNSYIFNRGVSPNTLSVISSKNRIFAVHAGDKAMHQIGVVSTFDPSEARTVEPVRGIGFGDHIAELVPGVTDPMTISITRTALYLANIYQVFGYKSGIDGIVRSLRHHRWPFDMHQELVFSSLAVNTAANDFPSIQSPSVVKDSYVEGDSAGTSNGENQSATITVYEACWISDYSVSYASDTALVQETVTINVSDIVMQGLTPDQFGDDEPYSVLDLANAPSQRLVVPSGA